MPIGKIELQHLVPIVGDGAIGHPNWGDGRLIPVLIVDCTNHPALHDLILIHSETPPGDVVARWGRSIFDKKHVYLTLTFARPVATSASFCFNVTKQGGLIDLIMNTRGVYLQPLTSGAKVLEGMDRPKIIVEIPSSATLPGWEDIYQRSLVKGYKKHGYSRAEAKEATTQHLARIRELSTLRIPRTPSKPVDA